jgi:hypothetical protein
LLVIVRYRTKEASVKSPDRHRKEKPYPRELRKVAVAALFTLCNFIATATSLAIVHEYYPLIEPLPGEQQSNHLIRPITVENQGVMARIEIKSSKNY